MAHRLLLPGSVLDFIIAGMDLAVRRVWWGAVAAQVYGSSHRLQNVDLGGVQDKPVIRWPVGVADGVVRALQWELGLPWRSKADTLGVAHRGWGIETYGRRL